MPTGREVVPNKSLTGSEIRELLRLDFERLMDNEAMLNGYLAYPRIAWIIGLELQMDNALAPRSYIEVMSRPVAHNVEALGKGIVVAPPLPPPVPAREVCSNCHLGIEEHQVNADETWRCESEPPGDYISVPETPEIAKLMLTRRVTSPNAERLRAGLGVPVEVRQQDGSTITEELQYPPQPGAGDGDVTIEDQSAKARVKWAKLNEVI